MVLLQYPSELVLSLQCFSPQKLCKYFEVLHWFVKLIENVNIDWTCYFLDQNIVEELAGTDQLSNNKDWQAQMLSKQRDYSLKQQKSQAELECLARKNKEKEAMLFDMMKEFENQQVISTANVEEICKMVSYSPIL